MQPWEGPERYALTEERCAAGGPCDSSNPAGSHTVPCGPGRLARSNRQEIEVKMVQLLFKRMFCTHRRWHKDPVPGALNFGVTRFVCLKCGKHKFFDPINHPINYPLTPQQ